MTHWPRLRASEWIFISFFAYIAIVSHWFPERPNLHYQPVLILALVSAGFYALARSERRAIRQPISLARDFIPIILILLAFREMEYFLPTRYNQNLENISILWDRTLLDGWRLRPAIEKLGSILPAYLELCYLLVYGLPFYCVAILYLQHKRRKLDLFFAVYLTGTLVAYAQFPFFPSQPPRLVFPKLDQPGVITLFRKMNLAILQGATIHVGVFPSAHVSSAFSAAWGMFLVLPKKKVFGWSVLAYAVSVSISTIYGRYHYTADVAAGFAVSLLSALVAILLDRIPRRSRKTRTALRASAVTHGMNKPE
jgi:membrane-associated phospholipid phosphatase